MLSRATATVSQLAVESKYTCMLIESFKMYSVDGV